MRRPSSTKMPIPPQRGVVRPKNRRSCRLFFPRYKTSRAVRMVACMLAAAVAATAEKWQGNPPLNDFEGISH